MLANDESVIISLNYTLVVPDMHGMQDQNSFCCTVHCTIINAQKNVEKPHQLFMEVKRDHYSKL